MRTKRDPMWIRQLKELDVCYNAIRWCRKQTSYQAAWTKCHNGGWMQFLCWLLNRQMWAHGSAKAQHFCARTWLGDPAGKELADLVRAVWPKPPKLPALKGGK